MKVALLTRHPHNHATTRLLSEAKHFSLTPQTIDPWSLRVQWPVAQAEQFDLTLNRIAAVEVDPFISSLMHWPVWGRQANEWGLRERFADKSRQTLWLATAGLKAVPFFMHRGYLSDQDSSWQAFKERHHSERGWVLKMNRGQRGVGVHFVKDEGELLSWLETLWRMGDQDFLIQPRLALSAEWRVTLLAGKVWSVLERRGEGRANFAQGGEAREIGGDSVAGLGLEKLGGDYLCVDILSTPAGPLICDVNTTPGFEQLEAVTGRNFARALLEHLVSG